MTDRTDGPPSSNTSLDDALAWLGDGATGARRIVDWYANRRSDGDSAADDLLDRLAAAPVGDEAVEAIVTIVIEHGLARPALRRVLVDPNDIQDAEQATLTAVALRIDSFGGRSRFTTWLHQVALNEARMLVRARARRPATPSAALPDQALATRFSSLIADQDIVERALAGLAPPQRSILELREVEQLEYDEIADRLDVPVGTVRSRLSRARSSLAVALARELDGAD